MEYLITILSGYIVGCLNPAYVISKLKKDDIRRHGTNNAGACNTFITYGKWLGIFVGLFDIFKCFAVTKLCVYLFPRFEFAYVLSGTFCIIGHIFPAFLKFRGGKGFASLIGMILSYDWRVFLVLAAIEIILILSLDYICVASISAPIIFWVILLFHSIPCAAVFLVPMIVIVAKHAVNIRRIQQGTEIPIHTLWKKEK